MAGALLGCAPLRKDMVDGIRATGVSSTRQTRTDSGEGYAMWMTAQLQGAFVAAPAAMAMCTEEGRMVLVNEELCRLVGADPDALTGAGIGELFDRSGAALEAGRRARLLAGRRDAYVFETGIERGSDRVPVEVRAKLVDPEAERDDRALVVTFSDLSERHESEGRLRYEADHDHLTGVLNRGAFLRELELRHQQERRYSDRGAAILMVDLDRLKLVNDVGGHPIGDALLHGAAIAMQARLREADLIGRLGGDEFGILVSQIAERSDLMTLCEAVVECLRDPGCVAALGLSDAGTGSVGASFLADYEGADQAVAAADAAMYEAKAAGGACWRLISEELGTS